MIIAKYPEHIEAQLKILDELIAKIYEDELPKEVNAEFADVRNIERIKRNIYERTKPFVDEKVRLINSSVPTYIVDPYR